MWRRLWFSPIRHSAREFPHRDGRLGLSVLASIVAAAGVGIITYHGLAKTVGGSLGTALPQIVTFAVYATLVAVLCYGWAGVCPGNNETAGKRKSGTTRDGNRWARRALCEAAWAVSRSKGTYLQAQFRRLAALRGTKRAIIAVANSILTAGSTCSSEAPFTMTSARTTSINAT